MKKRISWCLLLGLFLLMAVLDLCLGNVRLPLGDVLDALWGKAGVIASEIVRNYRLPKLCTAILAGSALSVAGLMMQTLFRNPLAGPDVLGINAGASLGVALLTMSVSWCGGYALGTGSWPLVLAAVLGAALVLLLVLWVSARVPDLVSLLIVGMMFGYLAGSLVSLLQSVSQPETLKLFVVWTFGSLSSVSWPMMPVLLALVLTGCVMAFWMSKPMDLLLLGDAQARSLGVPVQRTRFWMIVATALLAGGVTAFTGPIAFVGITVPHLARGLFRTWTHRQLLPACILCGSCLMLLCDTVSQLPVFHASFPINSVTALAGAPVIVWILLRRQR